MDYSEAEAYYGQQKAVMNAHDNNIRPIKPMYLTKERVVYDRVSLPVEEFIAALKADKPAELFVGPYSHEKPLYVVRHYYENALSFTCTALADKREKCISYEEFYDYVSNERSQMYYK